MTPASAGRPVTMVVSDLKGSTALAERLDSETLRAVLRRYFDEMGLVLTSHGGVIAKIIGDAIVTVFDGAADPGRAARRATRAALESQAALEWLNDRFDATWGVRLQNRTGVASGELAAVDIDDWQPGDDVLAGDVVTRAESLEAQAPVMEALIDDRTLSLIGEGATVEAIGAVPRKDKRGTVVAYRLVSVRAPRADVGPDRPAGAARLCGVCGHANDHDARLCASCGAALAAGDIARESRRMVTILFADPKPVTAEGTPMAPSTARFVMSRYFDVMRPILERHGATVEKFIGDALMAVFGLPVRHEDDALRAVRAAHEMQSALAGLNAELRADVGVSLGNPIGVNTGTVVAGDAAEGQRLVTGDAVNVAARLEQTAANGDVVLGHLTRQLVGDAVEAETLPPLSLKGKAEPVPAYRLSAVTQAGTSRRHDLPLVGRDEELGTLRDLLRAAVVERRCRRVTVIGEAGLGKSRLTHEFLTEARRTATVLQGGCLEYGDGITFWALLEMVQAAAGITEGDDADMARARIAKLADDDVEVAARLAAVAGLDDTPFPVSELVWSIEQLITRLAAGSPVVLLFDDIHWAEPTLLEVLDRLHTALDVPVLLLCTARQQVFEQHDGFVNAAPAMVLSPLTDEQCRRYLQLLLGDASPEVVDAVARAAGGNPLFLQQFLSMLIDEHRLQQLDGRWHAVGDLATLEVPASIEALMAARLDRLTQDERKVIEAASVIGREFDGRAVTQLVERTLRPVVHERLGDLRERELVEPLAADVPTYQFHHQVIRDATYGGLLKESRAILHEQFARWLDARDETRDRATELEEILGYHLEQAYRYWHDLGLLDGHAIDVGIDAGRRLGSAGERAMARGDMPAAANLLVRASTLVPDDHPSRPRTLLFAGTALDEVGSFDEAIAAYEASRSAAEAARNIAAIEAARIGRTRLRYLTGRIKDSQDVSDEVAAALERIAAVGDDDAMSRVWQLRVDVDIAACRWEAAQYAANQVIEHARLAGNAILERRTMRLLAFLAQKGPMPVHAAVVVCRDVLAKVALDRRSTAVTQVDLAVLLAMGLDFDEARRLCRDARRTLVELGSEVQAALVSLGSGMIEMMAGAPERAETELRQDLDALLRMEERNFIALTAALLADALYRQGKFADAHDMVSFSGEVAAPDDLAAHIIGKAVRGKVTARGNDPSAGVPLVRAAVDLIESTEDPSGQGDAWLDLAETLFLAGDRPAALAAAGTARMRYGAKGNVAGCRRVDLIERRLRQDLDPLG